MSWELSYTLSLSFHFILSLGKILCVVGSKVNLTYLTFKAHVKDKRTL